MERYDIAIIGTGPAGLSAAVTAKIRNKKILLIGSRQLSSKVHKAHSIQNYLGLSIIGGSDLGKAFQEHLDTMDIQITDERVNGIYDLGEYYGIQASGNIYEADSVILATGVVVGKPLPGENYFLGKGVSYCATCDAPLYKKKTVAIIGYGPKEEAEAEFMAEIAGKVYYFPMYKEEVNLPEKVEVIYEAPEEILGDDMVRSLKTKENQYLVDGVFILRENIAPSQLVPDLELDEQHVAVNRKMETSLQGLFACGDIVGAPYQYIKAAGEGNVAALSAVSYLDRRRRQVRAAGNV